MSPIPSAPAITSVLEHAHVRVTTAASVICGLAAVFVGFAWAGNDREVSELKALVAKNAEQIEILATASSRNTYIVSGLEETVDSATESAKSNRETLIRIEEQLKQINRQVQRIDPQG